MTPDPALRIQTNSGLHRKSKLSRTSIWEATSTCSWLHDLRPLWSMCFSNLDLGKARLGARLETHPEQMSSGSSGEAGSTSHVLISSPSAIRPNLLFPGVGQDEWLVLATLARLKEQSGLKPRAGRYESAAQLIHEALHVCSLAAGKMSLANSYSSADAQTILTQACS